MLSWSFALFSSARILAYLPTMWAIHQSGDASQNLLWTWVTWFGSNLSVAVWLYEQGGQRVVDERALGNLPFALAGPLLGIGLARKGLRQVCGAGPVDANLPCAGLGLLHALLRKSKALAREAVAQQARMLDGRSLALEDTALQRRSLGRAVRLRPPVFLDLAAQGRLGVQGDVPADVWTWTWTLMWPTLS